jgi:hypothetical protein
MQFALLKWFQPFEGLGSLMIDGPTAAPHYQCVLVRESRVGRRMSAHLYEDLPLEIIFGVHEGDHIRFDVLGPTCPGSNTDWYRSSLNAEIHMHVGMFRGYRSLVMFSDDFHRFRAALQRLMSGETVVAALETGDFLSVDVGADGSSYSVWMQLDALERDGEFVLRDGGDENWEWRLAMDRSALDALIDGVTQVSDRYPTWSVPRR